MKKYPNIIVIMSDDQGAWALGCAGNDEMKTPNIDLLAKEGIRFSNFFCASPVCSPARASFLTGRIPSYHGVQDHLRSGNYEYGELPEELKNKPAYKTNERHAIEYLEGITGYTDILAQHGYQNALCGKWHLGHSRKIQKGFAKWYTPGRAHSYMNCDMVDQGEMIEEDGYMTDKITNRALEYIDELSQQEAPFYISVHYTAPHSPWEPKHHPNRLLDMYKDCPFHSCPDMDKHPWHRENKLFAKGEKRRVQLTGYYAAITGMDEQIGRIIHKLEELQIREETLVIFTSDNGMNMGHHGIYGKGNGTFPQNLYDTSVKVPFIVSQPGAIPEGKVCKDLLSHYDFMPTIFEYLGIQYEDDTLPGISFSPILRGETIDNKPIVIFDEYGPVRMIRNQEYKYIHRYPYGPHEFYDLNIDPEEEENRICDETYAAIIRQMRSELNHWFATYVNPEADGAKEANTGRGQINRTGVFAEGKQAFVTLEGEMEL